MCGIAGIIARRGMPVDFNRLTAMCDAVAHRGPDDSGLWIQSNVGLGHRRLAIVHVSKDGVQPMRDSASDRRIVFNGAIYNFIELRTELSKSGYHFRTGTDTEVILVAYDAWGADCVKRFNGMWAFAIHDPRKNIVFCSRDRFGVRPFYYVDSAESFTFGSEIRQVLPALPHRRANSGRLYKFVFSGFAEDRTDSFFAGVQKLPAGHNLTYDLASHKFTLNEWYLLERRPELEALSLEDATRLLADRLQNAVRLRLRSDVPVGTCLSGGLDSSSIAAIAAPLYRNDAGRKFCAVTAVSEDPANDESAHAEVVARYAGLQWITVKPDAADFESALFDIVDAQEEPFASPSICMQYFVMRAARDAGLKVMLDGQGGDETLLGYERYYAPHLLFTRKTLGSGAMLREFSASTRNNQRMTAATLVAYLTLFSSPGLRQLMYRYRHRYLLKVPSVPEHLQAYHDAGDDFFKLQRLEIETTNLPPLLRYEDRNAMRHGIETRLPFLDYELVETALSLSATHKMHDGWTKYVLRHVMANKLPADIVWRKDKRGFEAPSAIWLRNLEVAMSAAVGQSRLLANICDTGKLAALYKHLDPESRWRLYSVALWERQFGVLP
ncbi:MAG: asparagine synthase (glutamine-hydrolyzing) [Gammaproteobacteria bacterium]|nr:asparagine synthase (glutamine-hydrolyzing) [Gammaproteobacteria bacterium]